MHADEDGDPLYVVLESDVELLLKHEGHEVRIAGCGVGDPIGEEVSAANGAVVLKGKGPGEPFLQARCLLTQGSRDNECAAPFARFLRH